MNTATNASTPERILQRLDWQVIRRLDGLLQGDYRSLFYGYGVDFANLREYQPGDDIRYIDWNVTARMDAPYIRLYVEDREITAWFLLDLSPSVDFGTVESLKRNVLVDFVTTLARLLTKHGNRVGAMFYGSRIEHIIPARGGRDQVLRLVNDLLKQPRLARAPFTDLTPLLQGALYSIKRRSLIFIISDFISAPGWERPLTLLNQRHEVLAVRLYDPREKELPDIGMVVMEDAETGEQLYVDTHDSRFRSRFKGFSDNGFSMQAPTSDQGAILAAIERLSPQHGTSLAQGINASLNAILVNNGQPALTYSNLSQTPQPTATPVPQGTHTNAVVILLTDGENNENPNPMSSAQVAADHGIRIYTVGIGSAAGIALHINGFNVFTRLDESTLQQIAQLTGGTYYNAESTQELDKIYADLNPQLVVKPEKTEVTSLFAGASILVMLIGSTFSFLWFNRMP
jgi:hypothetical protein